MHCPGYSFFLRLALILGFFVGVLFWGYLIFTVGEEGVAT